MFELQVTGITAASDESGRRTISGIAVPYGVTTTVSSGQTVKFEPGSLPVDGPAPKLVEHHDLSRPVGLVIRRESRDDGMHFTAKISDTAAGRDALTLTADGVIDAVSVGVDPIDYTTSADGTMTVTAARWRELSLVTQGAFDEARITEVSAAAGDNPDQEDEAPMSHDPVDPAADVETPAVPEQEAVEAAQTPTPIAAAVAQPGRIRVAERVTPGEYLAAAKTNPERLAEIRATVALDQISDAPGIVPTPIVAPVYNDLAELRPLVSALGPKAMPAAGKVFVRPVVTTHTTVAEQVAEGDQLSSTALVIDDVQVTKKVFGGTVDVSEQLMDWSEPSMIDAIVSDMARVYAQATEEEACNEILAGVGDTITTVDWTDPASVVATFYNAAAAQASATNIYPNMVAVSPDIWEKLGSLSDQSGRPVFPSYGPQNAPGSLSIASGAGNPLGVQLVVSGGFAAGTCIVGNTRAFEVYEQTKGLLRSDNVSVLTTSIAFRGYFATVTVAAANLTAINDGA